MVFIMSSPWTLLETSQPLHLIRSRLIQLHPMLLLGFPFLQQVIPVHLVLMESHLLEHSYLPESLRLTQRFSYIRTELQLEVLALRLMMAHLVALRGNWIQIMVIEHTAMDLTPLTQLLRRPLMPHPILQVQLQELLYWSIPLHGDQTYMNSTYY